MMFWYCECYIEFLVENDGKLLFWCWLEGFELCFRFIGFKENRKISINCKCYWSIYI